MIIDWILIVLEFNVRQMKHKQLKLIKKIKWKMTFHYMLIDRRIIIFMNYLIWRIFIQELIVYIQKIK